LRLSGIAVSFSWIGKSWKRVEETTGTRPDLPASLTAALADLDRWTLPSPDWEPLRLRMAMVLNQGEQSIVPSLQQFDVEPNYALSTLRLSLLGELGDWSNRATAKHCESSWPHGDCPVCGASPALAESRGLEQRRFLRCDRCGAGWPSSRLRCPFCGENDHHALRTLFAEEDQGRCRLVLCDGCGGRLKVITSLAPLSHPGLVLAQFTMLYLDFVDDASIAREAS